VNFCSGETGCITGICVYLYLDTTMLDDKVKLQIVSVRLSVCPSVRPFVSTPAFEPSDL